MGRIVSREQPPCCLVNRAVTPSHQDPARTGPGGFCECARVSWGVGCMHREIEPPSAKNLFELGDDSGPLAPSCLWVRNDPGGLHSTDPRRALLPTTSWGAIPRRTVRCGAGSASSKAPGMASLSAPDRLLPQPSVLLSSSLPRGGESHRELPHYPSSSRRGSRPPETRPNDCVEGLPVSLRRMCGPKIHRSRKNIRQWLDVDMILKRESEASDMPPKRATPRKLPLTSEQP